MPSKILKVNNLLGFTLSEVLITIAIVGILSSVALPSFLSQIRKTRQNEAAAQIAQLQGIIFSYTDENGAYPTSWKDLNKVAAIMTPLGEDKPEEKNNFDEITLSSSSCQKKTDENCYRYRIEKNNSLFELSATPQSVDNIYSVTACLDLISGHSDFRKSPSNTTIQCESEE